MPNDARVSALFARLRTAEDEYNAASVVVQDMQEVRIIEANAATYNVMEDMARSRPYFEIMTEKSREMYEISEELRQLGAVDDE